MNKYNKYYYEKYALLSVCHLFNLKTEDFCHNDKPDLQSKTHNMGIEVVQAISEYSGFINSLVNSYFEKGLSGEEIVESIKKNNTTGQFKGTVESINGVAVLSSSQGLCDKQIHKDLIIQKINKKSHKFKNYEHFKINGLYCFASDYDPDEFEHPWIIDTCKKSAFSLILINCHDIILQWNRPSDCLIEHKISSEYLCKWEREAQNDNQA